MAATDILETVKGLPRQPGVYSFLDAAGKVLYIGKARDLRARVGQYFERGPHSPQIPAMLARAARLEFTVTATEREALILESNMVRHNKPPYNILLKDDKRFPYVMVTNEPFPRLLVARRPGRGGGRFYGPFTSGPVNKTIRMMRRLFRLRPCKRLLPKGCVYGDIGVCLAPCRGGCTGEEYARAVAEAEMFLRGENDALVAVLEGRMRELSEATRYEEAAAVRDQLRAVSRLAAEQRVDFLDREDRDAIGLARLGPARALVVHFALRQGQLVTRRNFTLDAQPDSADGEILSAFIAQHYGTGAPPKEVLVSAMPPDAPVLEEWLSSVRGSQVSLVRPERGDKKRLMEMLDENLSTLASQMSGPDGRFRDWDAASAGIAKAFGLKGPPATIEGYDISGIQGRYSVGSKVRFYNGLPDKSGYRRYKIKTVAGQDDFAMVEEVVRRRLAREGEDPLPDLFLIDGGKGQLAAAVKAMSATGFFVPVASLAKREELFFLPGKRAPVRFEERDPARAALIRVRNESHRFAVTYHRKLRLRGQTASELDGIPGVGPKARAALIQRFGSVRRMRDASDAELMLVPGIGPKTARAIREALGRR